MNFIRTSKELFYSHLKGDKFIRISWSRNNYKGLPEPPHWQAHLDWILDTSTQKYVGYEASSSWNPNIEYAILEDMASAEMLLWYKQCVINEKISREKSDKEFSELPQERFDPSNPGLMEFLEDGNVVPYDPSNFSLNSIMEIGKSLYKSKSFDLSDTSVI